ncbi:hypothetical protein SISNIDRAFT_482940 [Sistotremastrum niveocremeum HHB9708]|uniref:Transmembrane protein n=1 Tax=Sistotremastrum niveocremeum HHB9708 TaxID=1314777 RepID=A0A164XWQ4_9AGAM|nr:hypothetical protein SISNIDRAFT_482940 [Sistotremastrum niveocremeum HHB9708]
MVDFDTATSRLHNATFNVHVEPPWFFFGSELERMTTATNYTTVSIPSSSSDIVYTPGQWSQNGTSMCSTSQGATASLNFTGLSFSLSGSVTLPQSALPQIPDDNQSLLVATISFDNNTLHKIAFNASLGPASVTQSPLFAMPQFAATDGPHVVTFTNDFDGVVTCLDQINTTSVLSSSPSSSNSTTDFATPLPPVASSKNGSKTKVAIAASLSAFIVVLLVAMILLLIKARKYRRGKLISASDESVPEIEPYQPSPTKSSIARRLSYFRRTLGTDNANSRPNGGRGPSTQGTSTVAASSILPSVIMAPSTISYLPSSRGAPTTIGRPGSQYLGTASERITVSELRRDPVEGLCTLTLANP